MGAFLVLVIRLVIRINYKKQKASIQKGIKQCISSPAHAPIQYSVTFFEYINESYLVLTIYLKINIICFDIENYQIYQSMI